MELPRSIQLMCMREAYPIVRNMVVSYIDQVRTHPRMHQLRYNTSSLCAVMLIDLTHPYVAVHVVACSQLGNKNPITARAVRYAQELAASAGVPCEFTGAWRDMTKSAIRAMSKRNLKSSRV